MTYTGGCHCGRIKFDVEGELDKAMECNCSHCSVKGYLLWFVPRTDLHLSTPAEDMSTYTFNTHRIKHHFCPVCGVAPFGEAAGPDGTLTAAVNVRCLQGVDSTSLEITQVDGRSH
ncbi:MAG: GFA family protein [Xanthomonadales bacterium]|nr:GFA family protein [Xanthomonadales bacterium]